MSAAELISTSPPKARGALTEQNCAIAPPTSWPIRIACPGSGTKRSTRARTMRECSASEKPRSLGENERPNPGRSTWKLRKWLARLRAQRLPNSGIAESAVQKEKHLLARLFVRVPRETLRNSQAGVSEAKPMLTDDRLSHPLMQLQTRYPLPRPLPGLFNPRRCGETRGCAGSSNSGASSVARQPGSPA